MSVTPQLQDALAKLDVAPMLSLHLTNASRPSLTAEDEERDPTLRPLLQKAIDDFKKQLDDDARPACMFCGVVWSHTKYNPAKAHGLAVVCEAIEFRSGDKNPMLIFGICERCTADQRTLKPRVLEALQKIWPTIRSMPAASMPPMSRRAN